MLVGELKKLLENVDDNAEVLLRGGDHSFYRARAKLVDVDNVDDDFYEWYDGHSEGVKEKHLVVCGR